MKLLRSLSDRLVPKVIFLRKSQVKSPKSQSHDFDFLKELLETHILTLSLSSKRLFN
jgi:hypothetical protein